MVGVGCTYDGHYVAPPQVTATCAEMTDSICEKIDSCLNPFEKLVLSEDECLRKAEPIVCTLSSSVAYAGECVRQAIIVQCEPLRGFLLDDEAVATMTSTCTSFFTKVKADVKK